MISLFYGIISYLVGLGGLVYFMLFVGGWDFLPLHINSRAPGLLSHAFFINLMLIVLFALQHSVMARQKFKLIVIKVIPKAVERSTYVLLSGACVILITLYWQPIAGSVWVVDNSFLTIILRIIHIIGWLIMVGATFEIDHLHLMGLKQVFLNYAKYSVTEPLFSEKYLYKIVRHPIQLGVLIVIWATPHMTMTLFMLSTILTIYIFIGLYFEELSLVASLGETYKDYQRRVPKVVPFLKCI